jgi:hypothetical protein
MFRFRETVFSGKNAINKNVEEKRVTCRKQDLYLMDLALLYIKALKLAPKIGILI